MSLYDSDRLRLQIELVIARLEDEIEEHEQKRGYRGMHAEQQAAKKHALWMLERALARADA